MVYVYDMTTEFLNCSHSALTDRSDEYVNFRISVKDFDRDLYFSQWFIFDYWIHFVIEQCKINSGTRIVRWFKLSLQYTLLLWPINSSVQAHVGQSVDFQRNVISKKISTWCYFKKIYAKTQRNLWVNLSG